MTLRSKKLSSPTKRASELAKWAGKAAATIEAALLQGVPSTGGVLIDDAHASLLTKLVPEFHEIVGE